MLLPTGFSVGERMEFGTFFDNSELTRKHPKKVVPQ
jgi:hypothetical protein